MKKIILILFLGIFNISNAQMVDIDLPPMRGSQDTSSSLIVSNAQIVLSPMWQSGDYWKPGTYDGHSSLGKYYAVDFFYNSRNRPDIYKNGDVGTAGRPILAPVTGSVFIHLLDITSLYLNSGRIGQFPLINAVRVFQGLDPVPQNCFSLVDSLGDTVRVDMSLVIDFNSNTLRTVFGHLQINSSYFNTTVQQKIRAAVRKFYNRSAVGSPRRVAISTGTTVSVGTQVGTISNWGIATQPHLHFQLFMGSGYSESSPYLGYAQDLSNSSIVTIAGQTIFQIPYEGTYGTLYQYPAMLRRSYNINTPIVVNAAWDGANGANLRNTPGGDRITTISNGSIGYILQATPRHAKLGSNNHLWYNVKFGSYTGWMAAEYIEPTTVSVDEQLGSDIPTKYALFQNYPNPFNSVTTIQFSLPMESHVVLTIFNSLGMEIEVLLNQHLPPGHYRIQWAPQNISSGVYFYQLKAGEFIDTKKLLLLK